MIRTVQCSSCSASFPVDPRKVPDEGVYARCSACEAVFFVEGGAAAPAASASAAIASAPPAPPAHDFVEPSFAEPEPPRPEFTKPSFEEPAEEKEAAFFKPGFGADDLAAPHMK